MQHLTDKIFMLTCQNLRAIRGEKLLFDHLGFSLKPGSVLLLQGANGCGKTTLLRMLAGLMPPSAGAITWQNETVTGNSDYKEVMLYQGHNTGLKAELSVYDNLQYFAALRDTEMLVPAAMQYFDLWAIADTPVSQLSSGWQRRVALSRLLAIPSLIWLLDEPAANLDVDGVAMLNGLIATRIKQGGIVVLSNHQTTPPDGAAILEVQDYCGFFSEDLLYAA